MAQLNTKLTIAIPTYNRPNKVIATLNKILPQLNGQVSVLVLDNCSATDLSEYVWQHIDEKYEPYINVRRNFVNLGADANFMRCFEYCETPYIWTLSDDDDVEPHAVSYILKELEAYEGRDVVWFNFGSNYTNRERSVMTSGINGLLDHIDNFENLLLLSTSVYNRNEYIKNIRYGYWGAYSMAAQLIPALIHIGHGKNIVISALKTISSPPAQRDQKWPDAQQALALSSILEAPLNLQKHDHQRLGHFLCRNIETFPRVFCDIILGVDFDVAKIDNYHRYIYKKIYQNTMQFRQNKAKQYVLYKLYFILLACKPLLRLVLQLPVMRRYVATSSKFAIFNR